ncbi:MAG: endo alpha-1,4 polygalactosaminidase [Herbiconiux sp.]|nr:endo alpha-1,4 polygalactosaminidase [Herbiconiux sp.]
MSHTRVWAGAATVLVLMLGLSGCAGASTGAGDGAAATTPSATLTATPTPTPTPTDASGSGAAAGVTPLPAGAVFDYQLGGAYPPPHGVTVVVRDSTAEPAEGLYNICYVNGFQTQPDSGWPKSLLVLDDDGEAVTDPNWPDESILDLSTLDNRQAVADKTAVTIAGCAAAGYDAVEFDNLDSYTRSKGAFTLADAVDYARLLVAAAHEAGLAAGQKNTVELGDRGRTAIGFDFAVAEECQRFAECGEYTAHYGDQVLDIEYTDDLAGTFAEVCADPSRPAATILRDRDLVAAGKPGHVFEHC